MKILITSHRFWPHLGGTEDAVGRLAAACARRGHDVTVATSDEPGAPQDEERDGYRIRRFTLSRRGKFRVPPRAYRDFVIDGDWDVIHVHGQRVWSTDYLYRHFRKARAPIVFTAFGFYQWHMERLPVINDIYYRFVLPRALRHAAAVIATTSNERDELIAWGVDDDKIHRIPVGFDPGEFEKLPGGFRGRHGIAPDARLLLYVGGFYPNKRVDRIVRAAAAADATLAVIGKEGYGPHGRAECETLAKEIGADVRFLGPLPRDEVLSAYAESDIFVMASGFEGFGIVLLEAMAAGLPFVSTPAGVASDLADHGGGVVAEPAGLARAVRKLLDDPRRRRDLSQRARAAVPLYAWGRVAERYLALYEEVAQTRRGST